MSAYQGTDNLEVMADARNYNAFLVELVMKCGGRFRRAVDFGAGIGTFAEQISERGKEVVCIEPDSELRARIRQRGLVAIDTLEALEDGTLEYVYSLNVLEHIENDASTLALISRKLARGGRLLIYVPAFQLLFSSMDRKVGHYRRYTRQHLTTLVRNAGLQVIDSAYADSAGFFATLAYKLIGSNTGEISRRSVLAFDRVIFPSSRLCDRVFGTFFGKNLYVVADK